MKRRMLNAIIFVIVFSFFNVSQAGEWRLGPKLSYIDGINDIYDIYYHNVEFEGYILGSKFYLPIGLSFNPYYEYNFGLLLGGGIGPMSFIYVNKDIGDDRFYFDFPLNINVGYALIPPSPVSPYVRTGVVYHIGTGDYIKSADPGLFIAGGIEFLRKKMVCFGFEVGYDFSKALFEYKTYDIRNQKEIEIGGLSVSLYAAF